MELLGILLAFMLFWKSSTCLRCYKCDPEDTHTNKNLCEQFDYSDKFLVDCPASTKCYKKQTYLRVDNGLNSTGITRGCAPQTLKGDQKKINGRWEYVSTIYNAYNSTCFEDPSDSERVTVTMYCYCEGDGCNGTNGLYLSLSILFLSSFVTLFNLS